LSPSYFVPKEGGPNRTYKLKFQSVGARDEFASDFDVFRTQADEMGFSGESLSSAPSLQRSSLEATGLLVQIVGITGLLATDKGGDRGIALGDDFAFGGGGSSPPRKSGSASASSPPGSIMSRATNFLTPSTVSAPIVTGIESVEDMASAGSMGGAQKGAPDPYVVLGSPVPQDLTRFHKTLPCYNTASPIYSILTEGYFSPSPGTLAHIKSLGGINVVVWDKDVFTSDDYLGNVFLP
jgi:hypothetical protein